MTLKPWFLLLALATSGAALAQAAPPQEWTPPPMVPAGPPPMPPPEPTAAPALPGTPPPPVLLPAPPQGPAVGTPYAPYGQPRVQEQPGPEVGLMVSESLFGMLTAAGIVVLPYYLLFGSGALLGQPPISDVIFILLFASVPLAVAQTQVSLANGSRHWVSETWPAALAGIAGMAGVLGIFYATGGLPTAQASGGVPNGGSVPLLFVGAIGVVPLLQMAVLNLAKQPRFRPTALTYSRGEGLALGFPAPTPLVAQTSQGLSLGVQLPLLRGTF